MNLLNRYRAVILILTLFIILGVTYSVIVPIFEAPDELYHYPFVAQLSQGGSLPIQRSGQVGMWQQEGSQPPLYYALAGALTSWLNVDDLSEIYRLNPHARVGIPLAHDNKNIAIHTDREAFPWRGAVLGLHLARLFSLLLAVGTLLCTYGIARALFPDWPLIAVAALMLNAFIPMFIFISASVNNDNLVIFLSSLTLWLLVRVIQRGASRPFLLALGIIIGLACLTKLSALGFIPLAGLALLLRQFDVNQRIFGLAVPRVGRGGVADGNGTRSRGLRHRLWHWIVDCTIVILPVILIAGWWYVRNWQLYGDPTGLNAMLDVVGRRPMQPSLLDLWDEFEGLRINFWGLFGVVNVLLQPTWIYRVFDLLTIVALISVPVWAWRQWRARQMFPWAEAILLSVWMLVEFVALIRWTTMTFASQGRLFFPALSPICLSLTIGLLGWLPPRWQRRMVVMLAGLFFTLSITAPFTSIKPAYARPPILTEADIPVSAQPFDVTYGDAVRLVAFEIGANVVRPGDLLPVTLYWQALKPMTEDFSIYLQLVIEQDRILGQVDSYPGGGAYPTTMWSPGEVIRDEFRVPVRTGAARPVAANLLTGLYHHKTSQRLPATDASGQATLLPVLARVKIAIPTQPQSPRHALNVNLDNRVRLVGYDLPANQAHPGAEVSLVLYWQVLKSVGADYTVFIHLLDENDVRVGQGDGPPLNNTYPTSFWAAGENLADAHRLKIPSETAPKTYRIAIGLYDPVSGRRLPMLDAQGNIVADRIFLASLEVAAR